MHESVSLSTTFRMGLKLRSGGFQAGSTEFFFYGGYLPSLRINYVAMNKIYRKKFTTAVLYKDENLLWFVFYFDIRVSMAT